MNAHLLKLLLIVAVMAALGGCSSNTRDDDDAQSRARVEDRSSSGTPADSGDEGAVSSGLEDDRGLSAASLDDPAGPLSVRVIYFDYDSANIRSDFADTIAAHASYLAANPSETVTLEGHADERGSREYNLALGERRALAVRRQLVLLGASADQVTAVSYGEERPAVDGHDEQSYGLNRRVELVY